MARVAVVAAAAALALSGCSASEKRGFLPKGVTTDAPIVTNLWVGSWIAALGVGVLVWGLIIFSVVAYRKRKDDDSRTDAAAVQPADRDPLLGRSRCS